MVRSARGASHRAQGFHAAVVTAVLSGLLSGCLGSDDSAWDSCAEPGEAARLKLIDGGMYVGDGWVVAQVSHTVTLALDPGECPVSGSIRWEQLDERAVLETATEGAKDAGDPSLEAGGFGSRTFETSGNATSISFPLVGRYLVRATLLDAWGGAAPTPFAAGQLLVDAVWSHSALLPTDGSSYVTRFEAMCCPGATKVEIADASSATGPGNWWWTFSVERTGEVIYEGQDRFWGGTQYQDALGAYWNETIYVEIRDRGVPFYIAGQSPRVEIVTGPTNDSVV